MLACWGGYVFETGDMAFDKLSRRTKAQWAKHKIIGRRPAGQYLGPDERTVKISGVVFPNDDGAGAAAQVIALEAACEAGEVYCLVAGSGSVSGPYRLESIDPEESFHDANGNPGRVGYSLTFEAHDDGNGQIWSLWP
ncbi:MAG: phage tail protein [Roseiarcus sp.]|jgi:phage protein U